MVINFIKDMKVINKKCGQKEILRLCNQIQWKTNVHNSQDDQQVIEALTNISINSPEANSPERDTLVKKSTTNGSLGKSAGWVTGRQPQDEARLQN